MTTENPTASPARFECPVRLTRYAVAITSPKTGTTVEVPVYSAPAPVRRRIVHAAAYGRRVASFTVDELRAFVASKPVPVPLYGGWRAPRGRRRYR